MFYLFFLSFCLILPLYFRIVVSSIDGIIYSELLRSIHHIYIIFMMFLLLSFFMITHISSIDDVINSAFFSMFVSIIMFLCLKANLFKIALRILPTIDYVIGLICWIFVLFFTILWDWLLMHYCRKWLWSLWKINNVIIRCILVVVFLNIAKILRYTWFASWLYVFLLVIWFWIII